MRWPPFLLSVLWALVVLFQSTHGFLNNVRITTIPSYYCARQCNSIVQPQQPLVSRLQLPCLGAKPGTPQQLDDNDNDDKEPQAGDNNNNNTRPAGRRRKRLFAALRKRVRKVALSLAFSTSIYLLHRPDPAWAVPPAAETTNPTMSLRPGMSKTQVEALEEGDVNVIEQLEEAPSVFKSSEAPSPLEKKKKASAFDYYGDAGDEDDDDGHLLLDDDDDTGYASSVASRADKATADKVQSSTSDKFAAYHKPKTKSLTTKVAIGFFVPTYGFMIVREYVRRRREENYVQKGLEILEAQKAEYFNVTETTNDADVEDELKGLKKNTTKTDNDDDDDDDDQDDEDDDDDDADDEDDEDEPEPPSSRRPPRKPRGDGGGKGGGGGSSSGSSDPGEQGNKPSDEDLNKLNDLFRKS